MIYRVVFNSVGGWKYSQQFLIIAETKNYIAATAYDDAISHNGDEICWYHPGERIVINKSDINSDEIITFVREY